MRGYSISGNAVSAANKYGKGDYIIYLYYDMLLAMHETNDAVDRPQREEQCQRSNACKGKLRGGAREKTKLTEAQIADMQSIDVCKNFAECRRYWYVDPEEQPHGSERSTDLCVFIKTRQEIEQSFKSYDDTLALESSHMQDTDAFEGWLFHQPPFFANPLRGT